MPYEYPFNTFPLVNRIRLTNPAANLDARYGPWPSTLSALSAFDPVLRNVGLTVGVDDGSGVVEYWFRDGVENNDFIVKQVPLSATNISGGKALTTTNDTNITLTLSGTSSSALLNAVVLSAGWIGQLGYNRGGTNASTAQGAINNLAGAVTNAQYLRGNGTNVVMSAIQASDVPTLNQNTTGSAGTLATTRKLWGQDFNGSQNVSGTLSAVGDIIGSSAITLSAGTGNNNINLRPSGTGLVTVTGNLSASNSITARDITATNLLSAASTFTRVLSVGDVQIRTVSASNIFIGNSTTGNDNATGTHNFVFGIGAGSDLTTGSNNNFLGQQAGDSSTGSSNTFIGAFAGYRVTGSYNTRINTERVVPRDEDSGSHNNFIGQFAGVRNTTGSCNNFLGLNAGCSNTEGGGNNFIGWQAGRNNTTGVNNNFLGSGSGEDNTTGSYNNFLGDAAGLNNTTGNDNIFLGYFAGGYNTTGRANSFFGRQAGRTNVSGSNNIIIGEEADVATNSLSGVIVLGTRARATESHQIVLSTANVSFRNIGSTFVIGTPSLTDNLTVYGAVSSTGVVGTNTGFRVNNTALSGNFLRGNGTNFVSSAIQVSDVPTLNQNTTGSAATLSTARTIAISGDLSYTSPAFNGSTNVIAAGTLATVNSNVGSFTNASVTVNAKGLVTAASSGTAPVTTVTGTSPVSSSGGTTPAISLASGYGDTQNPYASKTQNTFLAAPSAANGLPTFRTIVATDVPTLNQNTTGSAATLATTRTLWGQNFNGSQSVTGSLTGVGNITGTGAITIQTGSANQDITLSTSGTGEVNIAKVDINGGAIDGTTIGLTVPASGVFTGIHTSGDLSVGGNLFVEGSSAFINTANLIINDPIIFLAEGNPGDTVDIGFTGAYNHPSSPKHTGLVRDAATGGTGKWTLFSGLTSEVLSATQIPFDNPSLVIDTLRANIEGNVQGTLTGNVSGTAAQAVQLVTGRTISTTGDVTYTSGSFNGTANVTGTATIANSAVTTAKIADDNVTYAKIQNVTATDRLLGRSSAGAGDIEEIVCTSSGRALLSAANVATQRNTLGVGAAQSVTFGDVIVDNQTQTVLNKVYTDSANLANTLNLLTVPDAGYKTVKYTVQIKRTTDSSRCALEILATKNNATWTGTVYGIVDPAGLFADVDVSVVSGSVELAFVFGADNTNYTVTTYAQAISD